jgi:hypothetical protein
MDSYSEINLIDDEMETLIDSAVEHSDKMAMESAKQFDVTSENIDKVIEDSERSFDIMNSRKKVKTEVGMSLIFVSKEAIEHLKYVQNLREFLKIEASRMVAEIMKKRNREAAKVGVETRGKKRSRKN